MWKSPVNSVNIPANDGPDDSAAAVRPDDEGVGRATDEVDDETVDEAVRANDGPDEGAVDDEATDRAGNRAGNRASAERLDQRRVVALGCVSHC